MKTKSVLFSDIANHPNLSLSPRDYIKKDLPKYKKWMNRHFHYREDYEITIWKFIGEYIKRYLIKFYHYSGHSEHIEFKNIQKYTKGMFSVKFFPWTWIAFKLQFEYNTFLFFNCQFSFSILKPKIQFQIGFSRNTA